MPNKTHSDRWMLVLGWALLLVALGLWAVRGVWRSVHNSRDLAVHYCPARAMINGDNPYDPDVLEYIADRTGAPKIMLKQGINLPPSFVLLSPLAMLSWPAAKAVWGLIGLISLVGSIGLLWRLFDLRTFNQRLWLSALVLMLAPGRIGFAFGQLALPAIALILLSWLLMQKKHHVIAAICLILAACLRPQMMVFLPLYLLWRRQWWEGVGAIVGSGLILLAAWGWMAAHGVDWLAGWRDRMDYVFKHGNYGLGQPLAHLMVNLQYLFYELAPCRWGVNLLAWGLTALMFVLVCFLVRKESSTDRQQLGFAAVMTLTLLPVYHIVYNAVLLTVPLAWAAANIAGPRRRWAWGVIVLSLPFAVNGGVVLKWLAEKTALDLTMRGFRLLLAYQNLLLLIMACLLVGLLWTSRSRMNQVPAILPLGKGV